MASSTPDAAVVVSTYQRSELLARLFAALEAQTYPRERFEVVIIDNASADRTEHVLTGLAARSPLNVRPLRMPHNRGPAPARNLGWRSSAAPLIAFTDDDCVPEPGWLQAGADMLHTDGRVGIVQGCTLRPAEADTYAYTDWTIAREIIRPTPWFEGCNLFLRREALDAAGGFDESIGWFGEETALGWAVLAAGWDRAFADDAVVRHDLTERGLRWHLRNRFLEGNLVGIARRYPQLRREGFWRPWAIHRVNAMFALGVAGTVAARWRRWALLAWLPYWREVWLPAGLTRRLKYVPQRVAVDAAGCAGMVRGSVRHRLVVL
ncbi:MAG: glycosyltransferase family 2 protein [Acidimicrobiales bacterium]